MQDILGEELIEAQAGRKSVEEALASAEERQTPRQHCAKPPRRA